MIRLIKQDIINLLKIPSIIIGCFVFPWFLIFLFGCVFSGLYGGDSVTSYDYYGVTMMILIIVMSSAVTPNTFFEEKIKAANIRIAFSPVSKVFVCMSKIIASFIILFVIYAIDTLIMNYFNIVNFGGQNFKYILLLFTAFLLFIVTLGGAACVIFKSEELTNNIMSIFIISFSVLSGLFFPLESLGSWILKIADLCPLKWVVDITFNVIYDQNFQNYYSVVIGLLVLSLILIIITNVLYKPEQYI